MIKKLLFILTTYLILTVNIFAAGSSDSASSKIKTDYDIAVSHINVAKKYLMYKAIKKLRLLLWNYKN